MKLALHGVALAAVLALPTVAASAPDATTFPAETAIPARLTLLPANGPIGRENPFYKGYRPTFVFPGARDDKPDALAFIFKEGGRKVGEGELRLTGH